MNSSSRLLASLASLCLALFVLGCGRSKPPEPVAVGEIPRVLREAFREGAADMRQLAESVAGAVEKQQWTSASAAMEVLSARTELSTKQRNELARCLIAVNAQVAEAAAAGDAEAGQLQQMRRTDK